MTTSTPDRIPGADRTSPPAGAAALALPLLRATQDAALAYLRWVGRDDEKAADGAAVAALRGSLSRLPGRVRVVIGEGEKDDAPMLYRGEVLGTGAGPVCDVVVDPLDGTRLCARGLDGAVSVIAAAAPGAMWATPGWYMDKLVVGSAAAGAVSLDRPVEDNLAALAGRLGKTVPGLVVGVQDRLGNQELVKALRRAGAGVTLFGDGDVTAAFRVLLPGRGLDALLGIGGAPEGIITACAARLLGGDMQVASPPRVPRNGSHSKRPASRSGPEAWAPFFASATSSLMTTASSWPQASLAGRTCRPRDGSQRVCGPRPSCRLRIIPACSRTGTSRSGRTEQS